MLNLISELPKIGSNSVVHSGECGVNPFFICARNQSGIFELVNEPLVFGLLGPSGHSGFALQSAFEEPFAMTKCLVLAAAVALMLSGSVLAQDQGAGQ